MATLERDSTQWATTDETGRLAILPNGTVSSYFDREAGVMMFFCEPDPHPADWAMAVEFMAKFGSDEPAAETWDDGVLVFAKPVRAGIADFLPRHGAACPPDCLHVNPYKHGPFCPRPCRHSLAA